MKRIMQKIWRTGIHWDEELPKDITKWLKWKDFLQKLGELKIAIGT